MDTSSAPGPVTRQAPYGTLVEVVVYSFGYRHSNPPAGDGIIVDLRRVLRDPGERFRHRTGLDPEVRSHVLSLDGAPALLDSMVRRVMALTRATPPGKLVKVFVGCQGGRHRSVAVADEAARRLIRSGFGVEVVHTHVARPVLHAPENTG